MRVVAHRTVPVEAMHPGTVGALRSLKVSQAADRLAAGTAYTDGGLVVVDALGVGVHPDVYSDRFRALCRAAGVPVIRLHQVRHTVALLLHRAGEAPADVASLLGHTVGTHLAVYVPTTQRGARRAVSVRCWRPVRTPRTYTRESSVRRPMRDGRPNVGD